MTWSYYADPRPDVQALIDAHGSRILDVGCGAGALGAALKANGAAQVIGIEPVPAAAARARERLDGVVEGDVLEVALPWQSGSFDVVVCADVLEHLPDPDAALARVVPLLAPDGRLVISVPNMRFWHVLARLAVDRWAYAEHGVRDSTHLRIFTRASLAALIARHGLEVERLARNKRLIDDQTTIGRTGALATRLAVATIGRWPAQELLTYQYVAVARRRR